MTDASSPRRRAVVTGASRGLGATVARFLAGEGFDLLLTARHESPLRDFAAELAPFGVQVEPVAGDVTDAVHRREVARRVGGGLDVLVNNASDLGPSPLVPLAELPLPALESVYRTNVVAPVAWVQELLPALVRRRGRVVNVSSDAALGGYPGWGGYGASKAALDLVSRTLAHELANRGVSVSSVDPGDLRTEMHQAAYPGQDISDRPLPEVTLPFWAWFFHQPAQELSGKRFRAQSDRWEVPA